MAAAHLGETIDIHAGGVDLQFPHHENEIAQSECAHGGKVFARFWLHNGMLNFGGAKMSKSLGNIEKVNDLVRAHPPEALRPALDRKSVVSGKGVAVRGGTGGRPLIKKKK